MLGGGVRGPGRAPKEGRVLPEVVYGDETLKTQDGIELFCRTWLPSGPDGPRALVVICHGKAEHSGR